MWARMARSDIFAFMSCAVEGRKVGWLPWLAAAATCDLRTHSRMKSDSPKEARTHSLYLIHFGVVKPAISCGREKSLHLLWLSQCAAAEGAFSARNANLLCTRWPKRGTCVPQRRAQSSTSLRMAELNENRSRSELRRSPLRVKANSSETGQREKRISASAKGGEVTTDI